MAYNFSFVIPGRLAGMARPGSGEELTNVLIDLAREGVRAVVTLTEGPLEAERLERAGFHYIHVPIIDYSPPTAEQIDRVVAFWREQDEAGRGVVLHCAAGIGRTGTLLACVLVAEGAAAGDAIDAVRRARPWSIETAEQEEAIHAYARRLAAARRAARRAKKKGGR